MTPQELTDLRARCQAAVQYGRKIANATGYVAALESEAGPVAPAEGVAPNSAEHLIALVDKVLRVRSGEEKAATKAAAPAAPPAKDPEPPKAKKKSKAKKAAEGSSETAQEQAPAEGDDSSDGDDDEIED